MTNTQSGEVNISFLHFRILKSTKSGGKISHARFENTIFDFWTLKLLKSGGKISNTQFGDVKHT